MLVALAALPYWRLGAAIVYGAGVAWTLLFALWRTGLLWRGERDPSATTAVLYLPAVAGAFVPQPGGRLRLSRLGAAGVRRGLFSWLAIESVLLHRLYTAATLPAALRPTLGVQLAPPAVGALAYISVSSGAPDMFVHALIGYGLLQALLLLRLAPWIAEQPFAPSYWAFSFGARAGGGAAADDRARRDRRGRNLAPFIFVAANVLIAALILGTLWLVVRGRLLPRAH